MLSENTENVMIKLEAIDQNGNNFKIEKTVEIYENIGYGFLESFSETINTFLKHMGYLNFNKDFILMESLTEEEVEMLYDYLQDIRKNQ